MLCVHVCVSCHVFSIVRGRMERCQWVCMSVFFVCLSVSHHILIFAFDFVRSPGLPVITVGYFVRFDVLWAAKTLSTLGN